MMESVAVRILASLGLLSVAVIIAVTFGRHISAALDTALAKWRRLGFAARVVSAAMIVIATVEAQKRGGRSGGVESGGVKEFQLTHPPTPNSPTVPLFTLSSVVTNDYFSYSMPSNAVRYPNWWMRGAYEDVFRLDFGDWSFPLGTASVSSLWVYTWGKARSRLRGGYEVSAVGSPMSAVPQVSEFWHASGTNGSKILTWYNFFPGRIPATSNIPTFEHSNIPTLISAQLELFPNGDFIARSNLVERSYKRVNPDDWDDDGIPNDIDEDPLTYGGDNFGPLEELPDGADSNNYCWVEVVVSNANSLVTFTGDGVSDLPDPNFIARAGETNRVNLLIGKTYRVASAQPIFCTAKSSEEIEVSGESPRAMTVVWPVSYEIVSLARSASRQVRMIPPQLSGTIQWNTNTCCEQVQNSPSELPRCSPDCTCGGCTLGGFTFNYEGYSLYFDGIDCGCTISSEDEPCARASISFSSAAIIFEDCYTNSPNDIVPLRSTTNSLNVSVYGGPYGGEVVIEFNDNGKLEYIGEEVLLPSFYVGPKETVELSLPFIAKKESTSEGDITASLTFNEYVSGDVLESEEDMTVVRVEVEADAQWPENRNRHVFGPQERMTLHLFPSLDNARWNVGGESFEGGTFNYMAVNFPCNIHSEVFVENQCFDFMVSVIAPMILKALDWRVPIPDEWYLRHGYYLGPHEVAVGMMVELQLLPLHVSFANLYLQEGSCPASDIWGFFKRYSVVLMPHGTEQGSHYEVGVSNVLNHAGFDFAGACFNQFSVPFEDGGFQYNITNFWYVKDAGNIVNLHPFCEIVQTFALYENGDLSVQKFGCTAVRGTNNVSIITKDEE